MASIPQRHTYYGGETSVLSNDNINNVLNGNAQHRQKRKHVTFGPYILGSTLGEGEFGKVKLGWSKHASSSPNEVSKQVAIKLIRRVTIPKNSEKEVKIYREINALKHLSHPNIVKLEEVLQNSKYIGIVLEYASGGEFYKYIQKKRRLKEGMACRLFAQLISGVHYMHFKGLVHRDLKLENLLLDKHENLIITDFGFVNEFFAHNELMKTSCGSPCYAAPELVVSTKPYEARKADVWSCGIILYAMLAGYLPWDDDPKNPDGNDISKLYHYITRTPLKFPEYITPVPRDLLRRILVSDPKRRITLRNIQRHEWIKPHVPFLSITPEEWDKTMLSSDLFRPPRPKPQHSARPHSSCSTSSTGSKGEKRDSLVIDSTLITLPAPPQESQSHAKPSPPSPELRHSPIRGINRHSRSNSAASIALQAVVDAEREHNLQHESILHIQKSNYPSASRTSPAFIIQRSNTHSGNSGNTFSLMNKDSIIIETSPMKGNPYNNVYEQTTIDVNKVLQPSSIQNRSAHSQGFKGSAERHSPSNKKLSNSNYHHLTVQHRKPRPTSYHPGSTTSGSDSAGTLSGIATIGGSATHRMVNMDSSPFDSTPSLAAETRTSSPSMDQSPKMLPRRSFSVSKPSLDLQSVSGDLIRSKGDGETAARRIHEQVEDAENRQRKQGRRYSAIVSDKTFSAVTEEMEEIQGNGHTEASRKEQEKLMKDPQEKEGARPDKEAKSAVVNEAVNSRKDLEESLTEKRPDKKRFSFLSFYSSYNTSKSSLGSGESKILPPASTSRKPSMNATGKIHSSRQSSVGTNNNVDVNLSTAVLKENQSRRQASSSSSKSRPSTRSTYIETAAKNNYRQSLMISSSQDNHQPVQQRQQGDQSTAKKVLDFFKRRSMRI